jgi:hypothetical protein
MLGLALLAAIGCTVREAGYAGLEPLTRTELYFGLSRPGGATVSAADWKAFLDTQITPRFPEGLTVLDASGQWRSRAGGIIAEKTKVVILIHPHLPDKASAIQDIVSEYKRRFNQEAVLRVSDRVGVSF